MRVLVPGGAGYIGGVTAEALRAAGHTVTVVDDLSNSTREQVPEGVDFVEADVADVSAMTEVVARGFDACVHFAALIEAGESMADPTRFFRVNTGATVRLLDVLAKGGVERFVLSSTAAVYGDPVHVPIGEDDPTQPTNVYGESKLLVERALEWLHRQGTMRSAALRYFNAAGATSTRGEDHDPESHLIPIVLQVAAGRREHISIFGTDYDTPDGTAVRDYIHVADLADAHVRAVEALDEHPRIVCNLGNGTGYSVREVIETAREVTGHPIPAVEEGRRAGDPARLVASSQRAADLLGWQPQHPQLSDIIASAWGWHQRLWDVRA